MVSTIDYRTTFFEFPSLTRIHGKPTYETLQTIYNELKSNAGSVPSYLGGGSHGHLGLVLNAQRFAIISQVPYIRPHFPGPLTIPQGATPQMTVIFRDQHTEAVWSFREVAGVEQALRQQLVAVIDGDYLVALRNRNTNSITMAIFDIIQYLFTNHGKITPAQLKTKEAEVSAIIYDLMTPLDNVFNAVENLMDFAVAAGIPYSNKQIVTFAYMILLKTGKFGSYIRDWNKKPFNNQTWMNFKTHFRNGLNELMDTTDLTAQDTHFHSNMIQEIIAGVRNELNGMNPVQHQHDNTESNDMYANQVQELQTNQNIETLHGEISSLKSVIQEMQKNMMIYSGPPTTIHPLPSTSFAQGMQYAQAASIPSVASSDTSTLTPGTTGTSKAAKYKPLYYCWTHGYSTNPQHTCPTCRFKAQGHRADATAENRLGGCEKGLKRYYAAKK